MKKLNRKGFTLAELLIVVAIIAVLVAIAIPVFGSQLERSRETTDAANLRSAYAAATVAAFDPDNTKQSVAAGPVKMKQTKPGFQYVHEKIGDVELNDTTNIIKDMDATDTGYYVVVSLETGKVTFVADKPTDANTKVVDAITGTGS